MGADTKIEWADHTFNPWIGCTKVSAACDHCYAESFARRTAGPKWGAGQERRRTSEANWKKPLAWNRKAAAAGKPARVFCASLADVFDTEVPDGWRQDLFRLIAGTPHLIWMLLTKRPKVAVDWLRDRGSLTLCEPYLSRIWIGTTVENQAMAEARIPHLLKIPAAVRFLSCEPLLGPLKLKTIDVSGDQEIAPLGWDVLGRGPNTDLRIDWVIAGGESGPKARPSHPDWFRSLRDQATAAGVPFFFKQWGDWMPFEERNTDGLYYAAEDRKGAMDAVEGHDIWNDRKGTWREDDDGETVYRREGKKAAGRLLDGRTWDEVPA